MQKLTNGEDWWWQLRSGMCYYRLGLFQEGIRQHQKALELCKMDEIVLHLNKCYLRIDQPLIAAKLFEDLAKDTPGVDPLHPCHFFERNYHLGAIGISSLMSNVESQRHFEILRLPLCRECGALIGEGSHS
jgi:hypothetical protein